jgi:outer membrane protein OmpA-like peptidoglycan-associated protein
LHIFLDICILLSKTNSQVMASKKYILLAGIICLLASGSNAQMGASYDVKDSSVIPSKRMPQHSEFLNGTYNFPAKPRNQWEIGAKFGAFTVAGDVPALFPTLGMGLHVRKAFGYVFSMRVEYMYGTGEGFHWSPATNYMKNPAWIQPGTTPKYSAPVLVPSSTTGQPIYVQAGSGAPWTAASRWDNVFYNYKTKAQDLSIQGMISLNNIRFHKAKTGFGIYFFGGIGATLFKTHINAVNGDDFATGTSYAAGFNSIVQNNSFIYENRNDIKDQVKDLLDDSFETPAETEGGVRRPKLWGTTVKPSGSVGFGMAFKLSNRINIALEERATVIKTDLMDGQRWEEHGTADPVLSSDYDSYNYLTLGINFNIGGKAVEPLYWLNPLDYAYSEIRNPRLMRLPKPVLPDSDLDGVTDQFDQEQTPEGCPVDTHGVTRDTDGDGVPDCKDKEIITPTYCQPVDADGIGKCPCDTTCIGRAVPTTPQCSQLLGALPSVSFAKNSVKLSDDAKRLLAVVADRMRNSPGCNVVVTGYCAGNKVEQQRSWDRVNAIINYLIEKEGVSGDRLIFKYGEEGGDCDTVDIRAANEGEEGPNTVPAPHPNLRKN